MTDSVAARPVVVLVAMEEEAAPFLARADELGEEEVVGGARLRPLRLAGRDVLLVKGGIGLVNAAAAAAVVAARGGARAFVSAGSAGGIGPTVRVGDVVVGASYVYSRADARAFGYALGQVPGMPPEFVADGGLVEAATGAGDGLRVIVGGVISGDTFVDAALADEVRAAFPDALATDMESTAQAHTAHLFAVPFVSVRGISDLCGPATDFTEHVDDAADRSADVVVRLLERLT